ncbi:MAG: FlgO family outer membrane protein [Magnetococcus sp. YQC-9]
MKKIHSGLATLLLAAAMAGCAPGYQGQPYGGSSIVQNEVDLIRMSHALTDALVAELRKNHPSFHQRKPILVTSFVNRSQLDTTSELGNLIADHVASRLTQQGFTVVEPKLRKSLAIRQDQGEFILSRDIEKISHDNKAYAVVTGTYTETRDTLDFTSRMIALNSRQVLASVDAKVPVSGSTRELLINSNGGTSMPVVTR